MVQALCLYVDDSGDRVPDNKVHGVPWFALGGVVLKESDEEHVETRVATFRQRWLARVGDEPLHSYKIRQKKGPFAWMKTDPAEAALFMTELTELVTTAPIFCTACVIDRAGHLARYAPIYAPEQRWYLCKTAFAILLERTAKYAHRRGFVVRVYIERSDKDTDRTMQDYFTKLRKEGMPFSRTGMASYAPLEANILEQTLYDFGTKKKTSEVMQLADLCLYPVCNGGYGRGGQPYEQLRKSGRLIDSQLSPEEIATVGIKYSSFPGLNAASLNSGAGNDNRSRPTG